MEDYEGRDGSGVAPTVDATLSMHRSLVGLTLLVSLTVALAANTAPLAGWHTLYTRPSQVTGPTLDLRAVGEVMLARYIADMAEHQGSASLLTEVQGSLKADVTLGNLESPLTDRREALRPGPYRLLAPPSLAAVLPAANFTALSLANNHALDGGPEGLGDTLATLRTVGVTPVGAGPSEAAALEPSWFERQGLRLAVLAFNDVLDPADGRTGLAPAANIAWPNPDFAACPPPSATCPPGRAWLSARAIAAVASARRTADAVVVLVHWGIEYAAQPSARQQAWAAQLVAAGADVVLGAHPHVLQPAALIESGGRHGFVAYSLGNFLFDGPADPTRNSGAILQILLDRSGVALVAALPLALTNGRPRPLTLPSTAAQTALATFLAPTPTAVPPATVVSAWRWLGTTAQPVALPLGDLTIPPSPTKLAADLRGNGQPLWASLDTTGVVTLRDGTARDAPLVWTNEQPIWRFTQISAGDPNDDGRTELLLLLWQPDATGRLRSQPYLLGWRSGRYRIIWGGSATAVPIQSVAIADLNADGRSELVVLEGGAQPGDPGDHVSVWHWHGWGFQLEWRSPAGHWRTIGLRADAGGMVFLAK